MAHLLEKSPSGLSRRIDLPPKDKLFLGRSQTRADVVVSGAAVSGRHCSLARRGDAFLLADEGSTNGTALNGTEIGSTPVPVWRGDELKLGDAVFALAGEDVPERPASPDPAAPAPGAAPAPVPGGRAGIRPLGGAPVPAAPPPAAAPSAAPRHAGPLRATAAAAEAAGSAGAIRFDNAGGGGANAAAFKRKRNDGPVWIAVIVLGVLVALGLLALFLRGMGS